MDITVWYSCAVGSTTMVLPFFRFKKSLYPRVKGAFHVLIVY